MIRPDGSRRGLAPGEPFTHIVRGPEVSTSALPFDPDAPPPPPREICTVRPGETCPHGWTVDLPRVVR